MMRAIIRFALTVASIGSLSAHAYEPSTHAILSNRATQNSVLPSILSDYGLDDLLNVQARIADGAQLEDTQTTRRSINHFYNPRTGLGLPILGYSSSPDWALAPRGSNSDQDRSYWDARQYLFDALTKSTKDERDRNFGLAFQTLGHVLHHIQDMAQPQHVRGDMHCDYWACQLVQPLFGTPSRYERYTQQREPSLPLGNYDVSGEAFTSSVNSPRRFWNTLPSGAGTPETGKGIAEFTHSNFVSAGTNFLPTGANTFLARPDFPLPVPSTPQITEKADIQSLIPGTPLRGEMWFIGSNVQDNITGQAALNPRASTFSIFSDDLRGRSGLPTVRLNSFNFDYAHQYLIPRAVGYSAGMINYFFRGKIDLRKDEQDRSKFRVVNLGPETMNGKFALYYDALDGNRYPVPVDPEEPNRHPADPNAYRLVIAALDPAVPNSNLSEAISIIPPVNDGSPLSPKAANEYMLVFNGDMGEERAGTGMIGAVAAKMVSAPYNSVLYILAANASNQRIALRVDKSGTRVVPSTEFHPLRSIALPASLGNYLVKGYTTKQVRFIPSTFGYSYETLAATVGTFAPSFGARTTSWWKNPQTGAFESSVDAVWLAKSTDPQIGQFRFRPILGSEAMLEYQRTYVDGAGNPQTTTASVPLPQPPGDEGYSGFYLGNPLVISPDGLKISGFSRIVDRSATPTVQERYELRIALGETPTFSFVKTGETVIRNVQQGVSIPYATTQIGSVSTTFGGCKSPPVEIGVSKTEFADERTYTDGEFQLIDYYDDRLHDYQRAETTRLFSHYTDTGFGASHGDPCNWVYTQVQGEFVDRMDMSGTVTFSGGGVLASSLHQNGTGLPPWGLEHFNQTWGLSYDGPYPAPPIQYTSIEQPEAIAQYTFVYPVGPKADDAVHRFRTTAGDIQRFRGINTLNKPFVADASPIGEVFFATTDLSTWVHEPKKGPKVQFPPNVVRLIAVIWM